MKIENGIKTIETDTYKILFNMRTGMEIMTGVNGHDDPVVLEMPNLIDCGIMSKCTNNCKICYQGDNKDTPNMSLEDYETILIQVADTTNQIALGGKGNPDEYERFEDILKLTRKYNIIPNYTTSGIMMNEEKARITAKYCGAVAVSSYNQPYTYTALKMLMDVGCKTNIHFVVTSESIQSAIDLLNGTDIFNGQVDLARLNAVILLKFKAQGKGRNYPELMPSDTDLVRLFTAMRSGKVKFKVGCDSCMVCKMDELTTLTSKEKMMVDTCESGRMSVYIDSNSLMKPCSFVAEQGIDLRTHTVREAWNSPLFLEYRQRLEKNSNICPIKFTI